MLFRHNRSGLFYRVLFHSFSVERQKTSVIYMSLDSGQIFDRDQEAFSENFTFDSNPQSRIVPK